MGLGGGRGGGGGVGGGVVQAMGGGATEWGHGGMGLGEGGPIRVCLCQTRLGRKPRRTLPDSLPRFEDRDWLIRA